MCVSAGVQDLSKSFLHKLQNSQAKNITQFQAFLCRRNILLLNNSQGLYLNRPERCEIGDTLWTLSSPIATSHHHHIFYTANQETLWQYLNVLQLSFLFQLQYYVLGSTSQLYFFISTDESNVNQEKKPNLFWITTENSYGWETM